MAQFSGEHWKDVADALFAGVKAHGKAAILVHSGNDAVLESLANDLPMLDVRLSTQDHTTLDIQGKAFSRKNIRNFLWNSRKEPVLDNERSFVWIVRTSPHVYAFGLGVLVEAADTSEAIRPEVIDGDA